MRIRHRKCFVRDAALEQRLLLLGFECRVGVFGVVNVYEDDPRWPEVERVFAGAEIVSEFVYTEYSEKEVATAERLKVTALHLWGIQMPLTGWSTATYSSFCRCGLHGPQIAPYRFRREPPWKGSWSVFLCDGWREQIFLHSNVWAQFLRLGTFTGASGEPPVFHKTGKPMTSVVQLRVDATLKPGLLEPDLPRYACREGHRWTLWKERGPQRFAAAAFEGAPDFTFTHERFGNEIVATQSLIVSRAAAAALGK